MVPEYCGFLFNKKLLWECRKIPYRAWGRNKNQLLSIEIPFVFEPKKTCFIFSKKKRPRSKSLNHFLLGNGSAGNLSIVLWDWDLVGLRRDLPPKDQTTREGEEKNQRLQQIELESHDVWSLRMFLRCTTREWEVRLESVSESWTRKKKTHQHQKSRVRRQKIINKEGVLDVGEEMRDLEHRDNRRFWALATNYLFSSPRDPQTGPCCPARWYGTEWDFYSRESAGIWCVDFWWWSPQDGDSCDVVDSGSVAFFCFFL